MKGLLQAIATLVVVFLLFYNAPAIAQFFSILRSVGPGFGW